MLEDAIFAYRAARSVAPPIISLHSSDAADYFMTCPPPRYTAWRSVVRPYLISTFTDINDLRAQNRQLIKEGKRRELQQTTAPSTEPADEPSDRPAKRAKHSHGASPSTPSKSKRKHIVVDDLEEDEPMAVDVSDASGSDRNKSGPSSPRRNAKQGAQVL